MSERFYFRQLLAGRDFATDDPVARQMANFVYLVGDRTTGEALVVDPAYDPQGLLDVLAADDMRCVGAVASHYHADHIGGSMMGFELAGIVSLLELVDVPVHAQRDETDFITQVTSIGSDALTLHSGSSTVEVGGLSIDVIHTPGHTPGSQCLLVENRLVTGDTLFLHGCGRTDLPGGDASMLYHSLHHTLARVSDDVAVCPGHDYADVPTASFGAVRATNPVLVTH